MTKDKMYNIEREHTMSSNQKPLIIGLAVVIILLAAIVGVLIFQGGNSGKTETAQDSATTAQSNASTAMQQQMSKAADFDEKSATKLKDGETPEKWVKAYYDACDKKDWTAAWEHLPAAKKEATTADALGQQLSSYGITGYKVDSSKKNSSGDLEITVTQSTSSYGDFTSVWTFMPKGDTYLVKGKAVAGMTAN